MAIEIASSFERKAGVPLDDRETVANIAARDAIPLLVRYIGMFCKVLDNGEGEQKLFWLVGGVGNEHWKEFSSGSGNGILSFETIADRNDLPEDARYLGMIVYVEETETFYTLKDNLLNWTPIAFLDAIFSDDVGSIVISARDDLFPPEGTLPLGQEYEAHLYPELAQYLWNSDQAKWKFGGTGVYPSGTFRTPPKGAFFRIFGGALDPDSATRTASGPGGVTGNAIGSMQGHAFQTHTHTQDPHTHVGMLRVATGSGSQSPIARGGSNGAVWVENDISILQNTATNQNASASGANSQASANETRPVNIYVNAFIRFRPSGKGDKGERGLQGGGIIVATKALRDAIPNEDREVGLTVTVLNDGNGNQKDYWLVGGITNSDWEERNLVPNGGSVNQVLAKKTGADGDTEWVTPAGAASDISYENTTSGLVATDAQAAIDELSDKVDNIEPLPAGGTTSQVLHKKSATDYDVDWVTLVSTNLNSVSSLYKKDSQSHAFVKKTATTISLKAGSRIVVKGNVFDFTTETPISLPALNTGTDYAIYCTTAGALIASSNFTAPTGYTADDVYQIGGFHYGAVSSTETVAGGSFATTGNGMIWTQSDVNKIRGINEFSIWDVKFRPKSSPKGMVLVGGQFWADIYFTNTDVDANGTSKYNSNVASGTVLPKIPTMFGGNGSATYTVGTWWNFNEILRSQSKRMLWYSEFSVAAYGVTENQSLGGASSTITNAIRQPGYTSKWGLEQASGHHWTWGADSSYRPGDGAAAWKDVNGGRGKVYLTNDLGLVYALFGGNRGGGADSGSRASSWFNCPWNSYWALGVRGASDHLILE